MNKVGTLMVALVTLLPAVCAAEPVSLADELVSLAEERCDYASQGWLEDGIVERDVQRMYDACMRLSLPVWVTGLPDHQHHDLDDGAFWRALP